MISLLILTLLSILAAFGLTPAVRQALAIMCVVLVVILWMVFCGVLSVHGGHWLA